MPQQWDCGYAKIAVPLHPETETKINKKNGYENNESNANARVLLLLYDGKVNERRNIYNRCK
jgi:hypothetical protein